MTEQQTAREAPPRDTQWTQHLVRAIEAFGREMRDVVPDDFSKHTRGSMREALLAVRSLIDASIERLDCKEGPPEARKIEIE
jgi:hypothetical protein